MNRRELLGLGGAAVVAAFVAMTEDKPHSEPWPPGAQFHPIEEPVTSELLNAHLADPNEGDVITVISDGETWHIV